MLAELLILYRRVNGVSSREMAEKIGISPATYNRIENGKGFDSATLLKLINFLFKTNEENEG